jgi:hypothetical protein
LHSVNLSPIKSNDFSTDGRSAPIRHRDFGEFLEGAAHLQSDPSSRAIRNWIFVHCDLKDRPKVHALTDSLVPAILSQMSDLSLNYELRDSMSRWAFDPGRCLPSPAATRRTPVKCLPSRRRTGSP